MSNNNEIKFEYGKKYIVPSESSILPCIFICDRHQFGFFVNSSPDVNFVWERYIFLDPDGCYTTVNESAAKYVKEYKEPVQSIERSIQGWVTYSDSAPDNNALDQLVGFHSYNQIFAYQYEAKNAIASGFAKCAKFRFTAVQLPDEE